MAQWYSRVQGLGFKGWWIKSPLQHLFSSMQPDNIRGKFTLIYGNVYVKIPKLRENSHLSMKIPRRTKCGKIFHQSKGMCVGKFLEKQS
jgi:hypothetical protein